MTGRRPAPCCRRSRPVRRVAHAFRIRDDRLALRREFVDEGSDADLVVRVSAFERRDFTADERLEFAGAGERALDAVADGRDLPAHGLRHGQHGVRREDFRLGQPHGDIADCARNELHLMRAHGQHRGEEKEKHWGQQRARADDDLRRRKVGQEGLHIRARPRPDQGGEPAQP